MNLWSIRAELNESFNKLWPVIVCLLYRWISCYAQSVNKVSMIQFLHPQCLNSSRMVSMLYCRSLWGQQRWLWNPAPGHEGCKIDETWFYLHWLHPISALSILPLFLFFSSIRNYHEICLRKWFRNIHNKHTHTYWNFELWQWLSCIECLWVHILYWVPHININYP